MSLIQEALRRQQEESGDLSTPEITSVPAPPTTITQPSVAVTPPVPPPIPKTTSTPEKSSKKKVVAPPATPETKVKKAKTKTFMTLIIIAFFILLLIGFGVGLLFTLKQIKGKDIIKQAQSSLKKQETGLPATNTETVKHIENISTPTSDNKPESTQETTPAEPEIKHESIISDTVDSQPLITSNNEEEEETYQEEEEHEETIPADWPALSLSGVLGKGNEGSAIINGEIVSIGEKIEEVKILSVGRQGVYLEYYGETLFLKVGDSTQ